MNEPDIVLYTTAWCPFCRLAKRLLEKKGVGFTEIDVEGKPALRADVALRSGRQTVPQLFVDGRPLGGFDALAELDGRGELDSILGVSSDGKQPV